MVIAERAKQEQVVELGTATMHHRRVVTRPTPPWYRERRGSPHSRTFAMCEARTMRCSLASWTVVTTQIGDHDLRNLQLITRRQVILGIDLRRDRRKGTESQPNATGRNGLSVFINYFCEKRRKRHASHRYLPTMNYYCRTLLKAQKQDLLFQLESRFYYCADS